MVVISPLAPERSMKAKRHLWLRATLLLSLTLAGICGCSRGDGDPEDMNAMSSQDMGSTGSDDMNGADMLPATDMSEQEDLYSPADMDDAGDMGNEDMEATLPEDPLSLDILEPGPYGIGYRHFEVTYTPAPGGPERTIGVNLWYPTLDTSGERPRYLGLFREREAVFVDASVAPSIYEDGKFPVHLHSHGNQGYAAAEAPLLFHFVTHGWVIVAPDHTNNTSVDHKDPRPMPLYYSRPLDLRTALDAAANLEDGDPLAGKLVTDRVFLSGHSFGGWTTWLGAGATFDAARVEEQCAGNIEAGGPGCTEADLEVFASDLSEPRAVAGLPTAGTLGENWSATDGLKSAGIPMLMLTGDEDSSMTAEAAELQWMRSEGLEAGWVQIEGGCHETFSLGNCPNMPAAEGDYIVRAYGLAFARRHVLGDEGAQVTGILDGSVEVDARAKLMLQP